MSPYAHQPLGDASSQARLLRVVSRSSMGAAGASLRLLNSETGPIYSQFKQGFRGTAADLGDFVGGTTGLLQEF